MICDRCRKRKHQMSKRVPEPTNNNKSTDSSITTICDDATSEYRSLMDALYEHSTHEYDHTKKQKPKNAGNDMDPYKRRRKNRKQQENMAGSIPKRIGRRRKLNHQEIREAVEKHPEITLSEMADKFGVCTATISKYLRDMGKMKFGKRWVDVFVEDSIDSAIYDDAFIKETANYGNKKG